MGGIWFMVAFVLRGCLTRCNVQETARGWDGEEVEAEE